MGKAIGVACLGSVLVAGCATIPDVQVGHYLPKGELAATVVRTVGCATRKDPHGGSDRKVLFSAAKAEIKMAYARDPGRFHTVAIAQFGDSGKSATLGFTYYDDGRLKGLNSTSTGSGQQIVESAVKLATIVVGLAGVGVGGDETPACALIAEQAPKDQPLTLTYLLDEPFRSGGGDAAGQVRTLVFRPSPSNPTFSLDIDEALPLLCAVIGPIKSLRPLAQPTEGMGEAAASLSLVQPAQAPVGIVQESGATFMARRQNMGAPADASAPCGRNPEVLATATVQVPQLGTPYLLPIPKGALFGSTTFELALAESGALTTVKYGNTDGGAALLSAAGTVGEAITPDTAAERAAKRKGDADLIYQQQRLVKCQMDPATCPGE